jgi:hypothetical protein
MTTDTQREPTEAQIVAAARALNKRHARLCGVNEADSWNIQSDDFREDAFDALTAALAATPAPAAPNVHAKINKRGVEALIDDLLKAVREDAFESGRQFERNAQEPAPAAQPEPANAQDIAKYDEILRQYLSDKAQAVPQPPSVPPKRERDACADGSAFELWWAEHMPEAEQCHAWLEWCAIRSNCAARPTQPDTPRATMHTPPTPPGYKERLRRRLGVTLPTLRDAAAAIGAEADTELAALRAECGRLTAALKTANAQAEQFERGWYLRGDVLEQARGALQKTMAAWGGTCVWHRDVKAAIAAIDAALTPTERTP